MADVFKFYWPGDERLPILSHASYSFQIAHVRDSGKLLAGYLAALPTSPTGSTDLYLIAHSLGNRVILELLQEIIDLRADGKIHAGLNFAGIFMMAAAVPVTTVENVAELHSASLLAQRQWMLYSPLDWVLWFFPVGETLGFDSLNPHAVGRFGEPRTQWTVFQITVGYRHSNYCPSQPLLSSWRSFLTSRRPIGSLAIKSLQTPVQPLPYPTCRRGPSPRRILSLRDYTESKILLSRLHFLLRTVLHEPSGDSQL